MYYEQIDEDYIPLNYRKGESYHDVFKNIIQDIDVFRLNIILNKIYNSYDIGDASEVATAAYYNEHGYYTKRHLYLPYQNRLFTEIDMLCYNDSKIHIIENKRFMNASSIIINKDNWVIDNGIEKYKVFSPVLQQKRHIEALKGVLGNTALDFSYKIICWRRGKLYCYPVNIDDIIEVSSNDYKIFEDRDKMLKFLSDFSCYSDLMKAIHIYKLLSDRKVRQV